MVDRREVLVRMGAAGAASVLAAEAIAQTPAPAPAAPPPESPIAVTYIEVEPGQAEAARTLLTRHRDALRAAGALEIATYQRIGQANHFAIVEQWPSGKAREDGAASGPGQAFRAALAPLLIAPYDERPHFALATGPKAATAAAVHVVTHVDMVPPKREEGAAAVGQLAEASRGAAGNVRFDALVQASRPNHLTLVEAWTDKAAQEAHTAAGPTKAFRTILTPISGSLFDERLYMLLP
jgi:quinol monooxygenase YgiN